MHTQDARSVSCVIPCFNKATNLRRLLPWLEEVLEDSSLRWEIIVVDDGSTDDTAAVARVWCELAGFRCISLSRNFGKEAALSAGIAAANCDAVVLLDGDLQSVPVLIQQMLKHWADGAEVVYAVREMRGDEHLMKRLGTKLFYKLVNASDRFVVSENAGGFRLLDRKVVDALRALPERGRFMQGLHAWVGFRTVALHYTPTRRAQSESRMKAHRLLRLALDGLITLATWPQRVVSVAGLVLAASSFGYGLHMALDRLLFGNTVSGWAAIVVSLMFIIGLQLIFTSILGDHVARSFEEVKGRPQYVVREEHGRGFGKPRT